MTSLTSYITTTFDGILVIGDVHSEVDSLERAYKYARSQNLFLISLGDLVDRGECPFETITLMHELMLDGKAGFTVGNHDDKFYRYAIGNKVSFGLSAKTTLALVGDKLDEFLDMYVKIIDTPMLSGIVHKIDELVLTHAATHDDVWDSSGKFSKSAKYMSLVGEVNGELYPDGYPVRLYNWVDNVPIGKTVIVGHDMRPMLVPERLPEPKVVNNSNGGKVIFMDTGCGKGGVLSGAVYVIDRKGKFTFSEFKQFD